MNTSDLQSEYSHRRSRGEIIADPEQDRAVGILARLHRQLMANRQQSVFARLRRRLMKQPPRPVRGVYLYGGVGRGKSMLMDLFAEHLPPEYLPRRVHFHAFMLETHRQLKHLSAQGHRDPLVEVAQNIVKGTKVLCFDEFFVHDIADAMILGRLFSLLFDQEMTVVATSNVAISDLYAHGLQRQQFLPFIAIFQQQMIEINLDGDVDYRKLSLSSLPRYYHQSRQQDFDQAFSSAIRGLHREPLELEVFGRQLHFAEHYRGTLRASFADLCNIPLAAPDYLALAKVVNTLFINNIFIFDDGNHDDAARRFLYLIDCLYEAGRSLFLCAEAPIDQEIEALYSQGKLKREFDRAASRLHEMQTLEYSKNPCFRPQQ